LFDLATGEHQHGYRLEEVAVLAEFAGLLFANVSGRAMPLHSYLGNLTWYLAPILQSESSGVRVFGGGRFRWRLPFNWKVGVSSFGDDLDAALSGRDRGARITIEEAAGSINLLQEGPHADAKSRDSAGLIEGFDGAVISGAIYPNLTFYWPLRAFFAWHPIGQDCTEVHAYCLGAPLDRESDECALVREFGRRCSPGSLEMASLADNWVNAGWRDETASLTPDPAVKLNLPALRIRSSPEAGFTAFAAWLSRQDRGPKSHSGETTFGSSPVDRWDRVGGGV